MKLENTACKRNTLSAAREIAGRISAKNKEPLLEQIRRMGGISSDELGRGARLNKKSNGDIRIALVRPLGSLTGEEEREAVKEMGEPYQLELLAAVLMKEGYKIRIFDQIAEPFNPQRHSEYPKTKTNEAIVKEVDDFKPDVVGFTSFTYNFRRGLSIAAELKGQLGVPVILGGYHATSAGKQHLIFNSMKEEFPAAADVFRQDLFNLFQHGIVDYACIGEGLRAILDILEVLKENKDETQIRGIAFVRNGRVFASEAERIPLDDYPLPFRGGGFDPLMYWATGRGYSTLYVTTSSGCRYACEYCSTPINYPKLQFKSVGRVLFELNGILNDFRGKWPGERIMMRFTDEDFAASPTRIIELFNAIKKTELERHFEFNSFLDNKSILGVSGNAMLKAMGEANYRFAFVGIESMLEDAKEKYRRPDAKLAFEDIQRAIDGMWKHRIMYFGDHIAGYPLHGIGEIRKDYELLLQLRRMHYVYMPILAPMPGTPLYWRTLAGEFGEGFLPGVAYDDLDANRQVVGIMGGESVKEVRNEYVQKFFTRREYAEDADAAIAQAPRLGEYFFSKMLKKISDDYPSNPDLKGLAEKYRTI